ncbi:MAG: peptidase M28, partial [Fidelibacterota bacterium]
MGRNYSIKYLLYLISIIVLISGCGTGDAIARRSITSRDLAADIAILASDDFKGRAPSSKGEQLTIEFLREEFENLGLEPGNEGSYFQEVPMVELTPDPGAGLLIWESNTTTRLIYRREYVAWTRRVVERTSLNRSDLVFLGYGTVASEYDWNDYEDIDVRGKTVVLLVNDPG